MNPNLYESQSPFKEYETVKKNCEEFTIRKNEKKPVFIIVDGISGAGKTTIAVELADEINKIHQLPEIDLTKQGLQIGMGSQAFLTKLRPAAEKKYPIIIFDEAGEYNRRGWSSRLNKIMDKVMDTFRAYKIIIVFVLHDFNELPQHVWNTKLPTCLIHCKERPRGKHYGRSYWHDIKNMYYIRHYRKQDVFPEASYDKVFRNFKTEFKDLSPERSQALDLLSTTGKKDTLENAELDIQGLMTYKGLAERLARSEAWLRKIIKKLKIKPIRIHKKKAYFSQEIIPRLNNQIKR